LMEEHFNESYAESEQYPKTFFLGKIIDFSKKKFRNKEAVAVILEGDFTFHGVTKQIRTPATMRYNDNHYVLSTNFSLTAANYKIKIPKIVRNKIAEDIYIQLFFELYKK
jgi:polyisoprenoid-binding protein YceI